ncbi:MAG: NAD(P)/FAD-dependent oxidoreductase [Candidatus Sphingomonas colombiensis]|nr:NAD(P)/FAD-dependent oxidoreductase [Sphingomonas sp.]WEK43350.1 MAG: NAD(P)/FAD-dependent oxidoreductase [Sphingomonas sp.]
MLARDGHRPTIFERFETPQPVGSGLMLQPVGLAVLGELGLADTLITRGARIDRLFGRAGRSVVLDVRYGALGRRAGFGVGIHRASLFATLHDAASAAGIPIEAGRAISASRHDRDGRRLIFADGGDSAPFDLVIDALGSRSALAPPSNGALTYGALWASLDWPGTPFDTCALEQRYYRASRMTGVLPIGIPPGAASEKAAFFWSLRRDRLDDWRAAGLTVWKEEVRALWPATEPLLAQITDAEQLTFAQYAHRTLATPAEPALIHIGDAWHSTSPQLGQGVNMALLDAWAVAKALREREEIADALPHAIALRRRHVALYQAMSRLFTPVYQSDSRMLPMLRDWLVGPLSRIWPATLIQAAMVSGLAGNPLPVLGLDARD